MIKVENLTKRYAGQTAIDNLNFEVGKGEIMGFLGPNGAGKSTTMRILSSFMPPTSGRASIACPPWSTRSRGRSGWKGRGEVMSW